MINEQIRDREVRVIGPDGEQLGIMSAKEAYFKAKDANLDLVKIAPTAKPPVCKIINYGKYRYELSRKAKEAKKKQKTVETKEIRLSPNIDTNDLNTKVNQARKFLQKGAKVKVALRFRVLNPMTAPMESFRYIFFGSGQVSVLMWAISILWTIALLALGLSLFSKVEKTFVDTV